MLAAYTFGPGKEAYDGASETLTQDAWAPRLRRRADVKASCPFTHIRSLRYLRSPLASLQKQAAGAPQASEAPEAPEV